jgi:hypothetical protein
MIDPKLPAPLDDAANRRWDGVLGLAHAVKHGLRPASLPSSILAPPVARGFGINHLDTGHVDDRDHRDYEGRRPSPEPKHP